MRRGAASSQTQRPSVQPALSRTLPVGLPFARPPPPHCAERQHCACPGRASSNAAAPNARVARPTRICPAPHRRQPHGAVWRTRPACTTLAASQAPCLDTSSKTQKSAHLPRLHVHPGDALGLPHVGPQLALNDLQLQPKSTRRGHGNASNDVTALQRLARGCAPGAPHPAASARNGRQRRHSSVAATLLIKQEARLRPPRRPRSSSSTCLLWSACLPTKHPTHTAPGSSHRPPPPPSAHRLAEPHVMLPRPPPPSLAPTQTTLRPPHGVRPPPDSSSPPLLTSLSHLTSSSPPFCSSSFLLHTSHLLPCSPH